MKTILFHQPFTAGHVDHANRIIRDVTVITSGVTAEGHDLEVDDTTLSQMLECAEKRGKVPVKLNHGSGIEAMNGYLENFRLSGKKLIGDWHLLETHDETPKMLERAERMPTCFGMSAAFKGEGKPIGNGKKAARCFSLKSVDCVTSPAANPDGLFSARETPARRGSSALELAVGILARRGLVEFGGTLRGAGFVGVDRSRDSAGMFAPEGAAPGIDQNTIAAAYGGVADERKRRQAAIAQAWRNRQLVMPASEPVQTMSALERALIVLASKDREDLGPYLGAAASGAVSGAVLGAIPLLRRGTTLRAGLRSIATGAALAGGIVGGGAYVGSRIVGKPSDEEGAPFTKRAAIGGGIVGAGAGLAAGLVATRTAAGRAMLAKLARTWRPAEAARRGGLPAAAAIGAGAGGASGAAQGADEGQQVDSIRNLRKDLRRNRNDRRPANAVLLEARRRLLTL